MTRHGPPQLNKDLRVRPKPLSVYLSREDRLVIERAAAFEHTTMNALVESMLRPGLNKLQKKYGLGS